MSARSNRRTWKSFSLLRWATSVTRALAAVSRLIWPARPTTFTRVRLLRTTRGAFVSANNQKTFVTFTGRPVRAQRVDHLHKFDEHSDTAVVIQGPIIDEFDFTLESVKLYRNIFPVSPIILSTWSTESEEKLKKFGELGVHLVVSAVPERTGIGSHNLQMASSNAGLSYASKLGVDFAFKTRSDQRFHNPYAIGFLKACLRQFPMSPTTLHSQSQRIITTSLSSFAFRLYGLSDMLHFGKVEDLLLYWNDSRDIRKQVDVMSPLPLTARDVAQQKLGEVHFMVNFLESTNWVPNWTLSDYWLACHTRFIVVDAAALDVYWPKYSLQEDRWKNYFFPVTHQQMDFAFWMSLPDRSIPEDRFLDIPEIQLDFPLSREANPWAYVRK